MLETTWSSLLGLPEFLVYFVLSLVWLVLFMRLYTWITPHHEWNLIRANNSAAALAFVGALIGFALPLHSAITHSLSLLDCAIWGAIALIVQVMAFGLLKLLLPQLSERIQQGEMATGIFCAGFSITIGIINAACMSY